jgi:hypothetical protein
VDGEDRWSDVHFRSGWYGPERTSSTTNDHQWSAAEATLWAPAGERIELQLAARHRQTAELTVGPGTTVVDIGPTPAWYELPGGGQAVDVINNAGNCLIQDGYGADRGYLEPDLGQYDTAKEVFAWCGAGVLLRPAYLVDVGLFDERLFLYYEDFDLSWRGRAQGWRHIYVPTAVVRHAHSASTVRDSELSQYYIERNRLLVLVKNAPLGLAASAVGKYLLSTMSYARRDIISPILRRTPPTATAVRRRLKALMGFLGLVVPMTIDRRALRSRRTADEKVIMAWMEPKRNAGAGTSAS